MINCDNNEFSIKISFLEWDTNILGIKSGYLEIIKNNSDNFSGLNNLIQQAMQNARDEGYEFLTAKIKSEEIEIVNLCIKNNGDLIDTELTFHKYKQHNSGVPETCFRSTENNSSNLLQKKDFSIQKFKKYWHDSFYNLSGTLNNSRFFIDKKIGPELANKVWKESIFNSCNGRATYTIVCFDQDKPAGLINVFEKDNISDIFLITLFPEYQGHGLGSMMLDFYDSNLDNFISEQIVETQLINYNAQRFYSKKGYNNVSAKHTIHFWA